MKIEINGKLTAGYYNEMEASNPVFIDGDCIDELIKERLGEMGLDTDFSYGPSEKPEDVKNPLIGKRVKLILEIEE